MNDFYFQIHQQDGRIENFHLCAINVDIYLDLTNDIRPVVKMLAGISIEAWQSQRTDKNAMKVHIHRDLHEENDAEGDYVGYIEHYEL